MLFPTFLAIAAVFGEVDPVLIVQRTCYRRIITGRRLHERFIRHSLPCNSLEACQHQCSIEKHFDCQGFNIRLDTARVGRGICELSSVAVAFLEPSVDFVYDPEFAYYERDRDNGSPNCGHFNRVPDGPPNGPPNGFPGLPSQGPSGGFPGGSSLGPSSGFPGGSPHGPPNGFSSGSPHDHSSGFPGGSSHGPSGGFPGGSPHGPSGGFPGGSPHGPSGGFPGGSPHGPSGGFPGGSPHGPSGGFPGGSPHGPSGGFPGGSPHGPSGGFPGGSPHGPSGGFPGGSPHGPSGGFPGGSPHGASGGFPGGSPHGPSGGFPGGSPHGPSGGFPNGPPVGPSGGFSNGPSHRPPNGFPSGSPQGPSNGFPNGPSDGLPPHNPEENTIGYNPPTIGGPYYGGDSYGPWSTGHGTVDHGPWGSRGYGSGFYESNNPSRGPAPAFRPNAPFPQDPYAYGGGRPYPGRRPGVPDYQGGKPPLNLWGHGPPSKDPLGDRRYDRPNRIPTYIIIDADAGRGGYGGGTYGPQKPNFGYLPARPALPPPRPLPPPPQPPPPPPPSPPRYFPPVFPDKSLGVSHNTIGREVCFRREHPGYKLNPSSIRGMYETPTVLDCESMCTGSSFKCTGYSFRYSSHGRGGPNCLLTDFASLSPETHLLPDRSCDVYFKMSTCMEFDRMGDTECFLKVATNRKLDPSKLVKMMTVRGMSECELACLSSPFFTCRSFSFRHGPAVIGEPVENCFLSDWPISALTHLDFVPISNHEIYERGSFGHGCELDAGSPHIGPRPPFASYPNVPQMTHGKDPWAVAETWRHFTVSGWPCRAGTECQLNPEAGFWACEVEGGDRAQWDYCCRPKHSCGFSRGFHYPWCYVGEAGPDQWRPCSEHYYPEFGNRFPYKPVQSHNPDPVDSYGPPRDSRPWNFGSEEYGPPSFWPISYIYAEPPPNETYVWDPEEYHQEYHQEFHHDEHFHQLHDLIEESPKIKFKPCGHKVPYPRAIIQKLDLKNIPKAGDPGEQLRMEEKPRAAKAEKAPADTEDILGFSPENRKKENLKNEVEFFPSASPPPSGKRESAKAPDRNVTTAPPNKTKEVIKTVEKIIMETPAGDTSAAEPEKNETLKKVETKHPGFFSLSLLENSNFWN